MFYVKLQLLALPLTLLLGQCHQNSPEPAKPEDQLPAATQTGAGTFGCLVNGQPWTPRGNTGTPNFQVYYDPTYHGGNLAVTAFRLLDERGNSQVIGLGGEQLAQTGTYPLDPFSTLQAPGLYNAGFSDDTKLSPCNQYLFKPTSRMGAFTITRLDRGIVSGTFEFTLIQPGCDTIRVTNGRFDSLL
jgi:hypothetical protein